MKDPYDKVAFHGYTTDRRTAVMARIAERRLGVELQCFQGSYNTSVSASAGTHAGGGALDVWSSSITPQDVVHTLRKIGFAAWYRKPIPGVWGAHIHAIDIGNKKLSTAARDQVRQYRAGLDGLADAADDPQDFRPNPIVGFAYRDYMHKRSLRDRIDAITQAIKERSRRRRKALNKLAELKEH